MAFDRGSIAPQLQPYAILCKIEIGSFRKFTSVKLVGAVQSHGCGVDRPDLIHVFLHAFFETKRTEKSMVPESAKGPSQGPSIPTIVQCQLYSRVVERSAKLGGRATVSGQGISALLMRSHLHNCPVTRMPTIRALRVLSR